VAITLRPYQRDAKAAILASLGNVGRTLCVMATGLGKTLTFADVAQHYIGSGQRALVLAHREELIDQAVDKIAKMTGIVGAVEMAERKQGLVPPHQLGLAGDEAVPTVGPDGLPQLVVGSVQSMVRRLAKFPPDHFGLIIADEAHRAVARSWTSVIDHFSAKVLGVTATPKRGDKKALGQLFGDVAYQYEIKPAVLDGWLVPIKQEYVECDIDFSKCRTTAGDLNSGDLDAIMSEYQSLHQIAGPTVEKAGDRPTLVFCVTVKHAYMLAEVLREYTDARVEAMDGTSPKDERREVVDAFRRGDVQFLCNVGIYTEGFDAPVASCIAMARPTKSELLYRQILGRATRTLPGVVDPLAEATADVRKAAISSSAKPDMLVLDFVGNSGRHNLLSAVDVLDGEAGQPEINLARGMVDRGEVQDVLEALRLARSQIQAMELERVREQARSSFRSVQVDPFVVLGVESHRDSWGREITEKQEAVLDRAGINAKGMDRIQASALIGATFERRDRGLCTFKQAQRLIKSGIDPTVVWEMSFEQASSLMSELSRNKWRPPRDWATRFAPRSEVDDAI